jgi:ribosome-associated translation inhibitor RaiA
MDITDEIAKLRDGLTQQRDELLVQLNLAKLEAKDEWESVEAQLELWQLKAQSALDEAKDSSEDVVASLSLLGDEIKTAYERIKSRLQA